MIGSSCISMFTITIQHNTNITNGTVMDLITSQASKSTLSLCLGKTPDLGPVRDSAGCSRTATVLHSKDGATR